MCGIAAFIPKAGYESTPASSLLVSSIVKILAVAQDTRGGDNCGIYFKPVDRDKPVVARGCSKTYSTFKKFFVHENFKKVQFDTNHIILAHSRKGSSGSGELVNAHPFFLKEHKIVGCHNGTIKEWKDVADHLKVDVSGITNDSRAFLKMIAEKGPELPLATYNPGFNGGGVFVWTKTDAPNVLHVWCGGIGITQERPIHYMTTVVGTFISSEADPLHFVRQVYFNELEQPAEPVKFETGAITTFTDGVISGVQKVTKKILYNTTSHTSTNSYTTYDNTSTSNYSTGGPYKATLNNAAILDQRVIAPELEQYYIENKRLYVNFGFYYFGGEVLSSFKYEKPDSKTNVAANLVVTPFFVDKTTGKLYSNVATYADGTPVAEDDTPNPDNLESRHFYMGGLVKKDKVHDVQSAIKYYYNLPDQYYTSLQIYQDVHNFFDQPVHSGYFFSHTSHKTSYEDMKRVPQQKASATGTSKAFVPARGFYTSLSDMLKEGMFDKDFTDKLPNGCRKYVTNHATSSYYDMAYKIAAFKYPYVDCILFVSTQTCSYSFLYENKLKIYRQRYSTQDIMRMYNPSKTVRFKWMMDSDDCPAESTLDSKLTDAFNSSYDVEFSSDVICNSCFAAIAKVNSDVKGYCKDCSDYAMASIKSISGYSVFNHHVVNNPNYGGSVYLSTRHTAVLDPFMDVYIIYKQTISKCNEEERKVLMTALKNEISKIRSSYEKEYMEKCFFWYLLKNLDVC